MRQTARALHLEPEQIRSGQLWTPTALDVPGITRVRIVCRYPFAQSQDGPMWVIEHLNAVQNLDRISESTLRQLWHLESDVPSH